MANKNSFLLGYLHRDSIIHQLTGVTKLLMIIFGSIAAMITYDTRFLVLLIILSFFIFYLSKIRFSDISTVLKFILVLMIINAITVYLFSPEEGVKIYGTRNEIMTITKRLTVTKEELFYILNIILKYFAILPMALIFLTTTLPSEFASSLNRIGLNYRITYSISLALRYIPDVYKDLKEILQAQQARGLNLSKKVSIYKRIKNLVSVIFPLILSSLSKIDTISNAMELRGFGKLNKRTWYCYKKSKKIDKVFVVSFAMLIIVALFLNYINKGRFYNPFM